MNVMVSGKPMHREQIHLWMLKLMHKTMIPPRLAPAQVLQICTALNFDRKDLAAWRAGLKEGEGIKTCHALHDQLSPTASVAMTYWVSKSQQRRSDRPVNDHLPVTSDAI